MVEGKTPRFECARCDARGRFFFERPFGLKAPTVPKFLKLFEKIDWDHSGTIDIEELFGYLKMDVAGYARKTF